MKKANTIILLLLVLILVCTSFVACDTDENNDNDAPLPNGAISVDLSNIHDYFDIKTSYEHDQADYATVELMVSFIPKHEYSQSTVVVKYRHNALWDKSLQSLVTPETPTVALGGKTPTAHSVFSTFSGHEYDVKSGTNTITFESVNGYVIKEQNPSVRATYNEENGDALRAKLAVFQNAFNSDSNILKLSVTNSRVKTSIYGKTSTQSSASTTIINKASGALRTQNSNTNGSGYFVKDNNVYEEILRDGKIAIQQSTASAYQNSLNMYLSAFTFYTDSSLLGSVSKQSDNVYVAKNSFENFHIDCRDEFAFHPGDNAKKFDVETAYTFDTNKLKIAYRISQYGMYSDVQSHVINTTRTYEICDKYENLFDNYPTSAQSSIQSALDFCIPFEVADTKTISILPAVSGQEHYFVVEFGNGLYYSTTTTEGCDIRILDSEGNLVSSVSEPTMLDGKYVVKMRVSYGYDTPNTLNATFTKYARTTVPDYNNPTKVGSDGILSGTIECWGDKEVFEITITDELNEIKLLSDTSVSINITKQGDDTSHGIQATASSFVRLSPATYQIEVLTHDKNACNIDYQIEIKSANKAIDGFEITDADTTIPMFRYFDFVDGMATFTATMQISEDGNYKIVSTDNLIYGYVEIFDANGTEIRKPYGSDAFTLTAGTYTVKISSNFLTEPLDVNVRYEKAS